VKDLLLLATEIKRTHAREAVSSSSSSSSLPVEKKLAFPHAVCHYEFKSKLLLQRVTDDCLQTAVALRLL
jgi:hypothetical protein